MRRVPEIVLGGLVATAFWAGILLWQSQKPIVHNQAPPAKTEQQHAVSNSVSSQQEQHGKGHQKGNWYDTFLNHTPDWFVALFTALLGFVTYRLVSTTGDLRDSTDKLWEAGERQLEHLDHTSKQQLRAYVHIEKVDVIGKVNTDEAPHFRITFKNYGSTPAYKVSHTYGISLVFPGGNPKHRKPKITRFSDLGPSQHRNSLYFFGDVVWQIMRPGLKEENGKIFVDGEITYFDAFQIKEGATEPHRTRYRFRLVETENGNGVLWFADEGNDSN